jgi:hypothetical protein
MNNLSNEISQANQQDLPDNNVQVNELLTDDNVQTNQARFTR